MRLSEQDAERLYRERAPSEKVSPSERLAYHLGQMIEFAWNGKAFAEQTMLSISPGRTVVSLVSTDVFRAIKISSSAIEDVLKEEPCADFLRELRSCWSAFMSLLTALRDRQKSVSDDTARRSFLLLFLATLIMKEAVTSSVSKKTVLREKEVFGAEIYPLTADEKSLTKSLPVAIFDEHFSFSEQLKAMTHNLNSITLLIPRT